MLIVKKKFCTKLFNIKRQNFNLNLLIYLRIVFESKQQQTVFLNFT